jgi:ankyrin repeat protein
MPSAALEALYAGDAGRARGLLAPDRELSVFDAAAFGRAERLCEILAADPSQARAYADDGFTALHLAVFAREETAARILIEHGADVGAVSSGPIAQVPPLGTAAFVRSTRLARLLLDAGARVDASVLETARANGDGELLALLERGAEPDSA